MEGTDGTPRRSWLCIAYAFPPILRSGTHRTLAFVRHLDRAGWDATVLTVDPANEPMDPALLGAIPESTGVIRTSCPMPYAALSRLRRRCTSRRAGHLLPSHVQPPVDRRSSFESRRSFSDWVSRLMQTPDSRIGWLAPAVRAGWRAIRQHRPDIVYSTSPCASAHLIGLALSRLSNRPWVADFRDPWCANPYRVLPYRSLRRLEAWLERLVVRNASHVICNTRTAAGDFARRYPDVAPRCTAIPNGIDFDRPAPNPPDRDAHAEAFVLLHSGQFYGPRSPLPLLRAVRRTGSAPHAGRSVRLVLLGPDTFDGRSLRELTFQAGVADRVAVAGLKSQGEALFRMAAADALVLVGGTGPGADLQVPNKLYEYLALRRPILALLGHAHPARQILAESHADAFVCEPTDVEGIARAIAALADPLRTVPPDAWSGVHRFDRAHRAAELHAVFEKVYRARRVAERRPDYMPYRIKGLVARSRPMVVSGP